MRKYLFLLAFAMVCIVSEAWAAPAFGRYTGILRHEGIKRDQLAKLDFILSRESLGKFELMAILTLQFGDYKSGEYISYHFDNVQYNALTQTMVFDQPDQEISLVVNKFTGGTFEGELRSVFSGNVGTLILKDSGTVAVKFPLIETLGGEYEGTCHNLPTRLQLHTYRSTDDTSKIGNPFAAYKLRGHLGEKKPGGACLGGSQGYCLWAVFDAGAYNFFKEQLLITGPKRTMSCTTTSTSLECGTGCSLKRISREMEEPRTLDPVVLDEGFQFTSSTVDPALKAPLDSIQGEYTGYVYHEYLNVYQKASLNLLTYQGASSPGEQPKLQMSAVASLIFGSSTGAESLSYRFDTRPYPNPLSATQFVFKRPENDVDAVLHVTEFADGTVKGTWYSILFGRVGKFELRKDGNVKLPAGAKLMQPLSGLYESSNWDLNIVVGLGKTPPNTDNPFFPLSFGGWATFKIAGGRTPFTGGSYDFYTGKIGYEAGEISAFLGDRDRLGDISLKKLGQAVSAPYAPFELSPFRKMPY